MREYVNFCHSVWTIVTSYIRNVCLKHARKSAVFLLMVNCRINNFRQFDVPAHATE